MTIVATGSIASFFDEVVEDALKVRHVEASQSAHRYLVGVLADFAHPEDLVSLSRPLALSLQEALVTNPPAERFERLRQLGDAVLYASGFFADHFAARGLETRYVSSVGSRAYISAAAILGPNATLGVFEELAHRFDDFASVLSEVANITAANATATPQNILKLYERWLKTGSETVSDALVSQGIFPTKGSKGVQ